MATTTTTQTQALNPFIQDILARNYGAAQQVASIPYQAYGGPRIANKLVCRNCNRLLM